MRQMIFWGMVRVVLLSAEERQRALLRDLAEPWLLQQLWELGDIGEDALRLIARASGSSRLNS